MLNKSFLCCLLLMLPSYFLGQVLEEINQESKGLVDPNQYPFEIYFKLGLPGGSFVYETGHQNINKIFQDEGINIPKIRQVNVFEVGLRYKRLYAEIGGATDFVNSPIPPFSNNDFSVNPSYNLGWVDLGFSVRQNRNSALLLRLGLGQIASSYDIRPLQSASPLDFDDLFTEGGNPSRLIYHENTFMDVSLEWWGGRSKSRTSFGEAIRIGYRRGIEETPWQAIDANSVNAPLDLAGEFYLNISFHLGHAFPKKSK